MIPNHRRPSATDEPHPPELGARCSCFRPKSKTCFRFFSSTRLENPRAPGCQGVGCLVPQAPRKKTKMCSERKEIDGGNDALNTNLHNNGDYDDDNDAHLLLGMQQPHAHKQRQGRRRRRRRKPLKSRRKTCEVCRCSEWLLIVLCAMAVFIKSGMWSTVGPLASSIRSRTCSISSSPALFNSPPSNHNNNTGSSSRISSSMERTTEYHESADSRVMTCSAAWEMNIGMLSSWCPITYLIAMRPTASILNRAHSSRKAAMAASALLAAGGLLQYISARTPTQHSIIILLFLHAGTMLVGIAGPLAVAAGPVAAYAKLSDARSRVATLSICMVADALGPIAAYAAVPVMMAEVDNGASVYLCASGMALMLLALLCCTLFIQPVSQSTNLNEGGDDDEEENEEEEEEEEEEGHAKDACVDRSGDSSSRWKELRGSNLDQEWDESGALILPAYPGPYWLIFFGFVFDYGFFGVWGSLLWPSLGAPQTQNPKPRTLSGPILHVSKTQTPKPKTQIPPWANPSCPSKIPIPSTLLYKSRKIRILKPENPESQATWWPPRATECCGTRYPPRGERPQPFRSNLL